LFVDAAWAYKVAEWKLVEQIGANWRADCAAIAPRKRWQRGPGSYLGSADGESIRELAEHLEVTQRTVCLWRRRYREAGPAGLRSLPRLGRPRTISAAEERAVLSATMRKPVVATHWSTRRLAKAVGLSRASVHRIWQKYGLQPQRVETFKFSTDPDFERKLTDVVGLYLDPPERALVLCMDEKSQIQALNRTQPRLPMWPGLPARRTHDYTRHGTTSLFAALEVASGKVHARCFRRQRHEEFIAFLNSLVRRYPGHQIYLNLRQLRNSQASGGKALAGCASAHPSPLHSDRGLVAQLGRALVWVDHGPGDPARQL
jgi:transposase